MEFLTRAGAKGMLMVFRVLFYAESGAYGIPLGRLRIYFGMGITGLVFLFGFFSVTLSRFGTDAEIWGPRACE